MDTEMIQNLLYSMSSEDAQKILSTCTSSATLHIYAFNYNWSSGFDLPQTILDNPACTLGTALMIFTWPMDIVILPKEADLQISRSGCHLLRTFISALFPVVLQIDRSHFPSRFPRCRSSSLKSSSMKMSSFL